MSIVEFGWRVPAKKGDYWSLSVKLRNGFFSIYVSDLTDHEERSECRSFADFLAEMKDRLLAKIDGLTHVEAETHPDNEYSFKCEIDLGKVEHIKSELRKFVSEIQENSDRYYCVLV